jgi:hypothetical protein
MPPILAQMRGNAIRPGAKGRFGKRHRIGMGAAARIPNGRDMIDIDP